MALEDTEIAAPIPPPDSPAIEAPAVEKPSVADPAGAEPSEKKLSLREQILSAKDEVEKKARNPYHDKDTGKFTNRPKGSRVEAQDAPQEARAEIPQDRKDAQPDTAPASTPVLGPPPGWSKESKALFDTLPASIIADVLKREGEVNSGFKQKSDELRRYQEIEQVLAPVRASYQQHGVASDAEAVRRLFQWESAIRRDTPNAIRALARQYGVDLSTLVQGSPEPSAAPNDAFSQVRPVLDQYGSKIAEVSQAVSQIQEARTADTISSFAKDKPHFDKVRVLMGQLMASGAATSLEDAYNKAIYADEGVRTSILQEQEAKKLAELNKQQNDKANAARKAAVSISTRSPSGPVVNGNANPKGGNGVRGSILAAVNQLREDSRA